MDRKLFDHTILKADATKEAVKKVCREAAEYGFMSVCVKRLLHILRAGTVKGKRREGLYGGGLSSGADEHQGQSGGGEDRRGRRSG